MKVLHVVPSYLPAMAYGGPIETTAQICRNLVLNGHEVDVLTTDSCGPSQTISDAAQTRTADRCGYSIKYCHRVASESIAPSLLLWLPWKMVKADLVHLTAVYSFPTIPTLVLSWLLNKPLVWSPRGALQRWPGMRKRWLKWIWERTCSPFLHARTIIHATAESEKLDIRKVFPGAKISVIRNGVSVPPRASIARFERSNILRLLFIGRLDPKKGLEKFLSALSIVRRKYLMKFEVKIAGSGRLEYEQIIRKRIQVLGLSKDIAMLGHVGRVRRRKLYGWANICVVPSYRENFGMVIAEALAHGRPVIASKGTPWRDLTRRSCGWWVSNHSPILARTIVQASKCQLASMGLCGRNWMKKEFDWSAVTKAMEAIYFRLVDRGLC